MILVTGGAGFIGANFVLGWLREPKAEGVINLDKLTYAGNLATLDSLKSDSRHVFVHGDIRDQELVTRLLASNLHVEFVQDNHSFSRQWTLRGLHYQLKHTQGKLVRVTAGCVFDVAVDLRKDSTTFGKWVGLELSAENHKQLWIPPGFAHGFLVLSETAEFLYKTTDYYDPQSEVCLSWCDPSIKIDWPIPLGKQALLNAKDTAGLSWDQAPKF